MKNIEGVNKLVLKNMIISEKNFITINYLAILVIVYRLITFILDWRNVFLSNWLSFSIGSNDVAFFILFIIPVPVGIYFLALIIYLILALYLLLRSKNESVDGWIDDWTVSCLFFVFIGSLGSWALSILNTAK